MLKGLIMSKNIAFIKMGNYSGTNDKVLEILAKYFPEYKVEVIDILTDFIKKKKSIIIINLLFVLLEYGIDILMRRKEARACFFKTTYIFKKVKSEISLYLSRGKYVFSFQTQSLFDLSSGGIPHFIYTDHTHLTNIYYTGFEKSGLFKKWVGLEKTIYRNATLNFTMSSNISKSIIEQYSIEPEKVVCVYGGSNTKINTRAAECRSKYKTKNILFVGVNWERKGGPELVEAFKIVQKKHPDARLTIVGCSPVLNIPNCDVVGKVPLDEVSKFYGRAAIFCLPTKREPFGIVFIEAASHKLPIVSTKIGALPELVSDGETGYLVEIGDIVGLSQKLISLVSDPQRCQVFGERWRRNIAEKYSWANTGTMMKRNIVSKLNSNC